MRKTFGIWALFCSMVAFSSSAHAELSVQQLINQTPENGTITLDNKIYEGNVVVDKPLTIIGSGQTVIKGDGTGNVIMIKAPGVRIENVAVTNSSFNRNTSEEFAGVKVLTNDNVLKDLVVTDSYHGVYLSQAHHNQIINVHVTGRQEKEIAGQGNGIMVYYSNENQLIDNTITKTRDGIFFDYANENMVKGNEISHTRYGLHYMYSDGNEFHRNKFFANTGGAALMHSKRMVLSENQFALNQGTRAFGVLLQSCDDSQIVNNHFFQNQRALYIDQSQRNRIVDNEIYQNQVGIEIWASSSDHIFTQNRFTNNTAPVITLGGKARNEWNEKGVGNDWGKDFPLLDLDQNGIGDHPVQYQSSLYQLIEENELVYLFLDSPAIDIYELIQKFLNQQQTMLEDTVPIVTKQNIISSPWWLVMLFPIGLGLYMRERRRKA